MRAPLLSRDQTSVGLAICAIAAIACLAPVHNDTWWHLAYGREMASQGGFAQVDRFSHTAYGAAFPNHQWLGARVLYAVYAVGGLPLLTGMCAGLLTLTWALCWRLSSGPTLERLAVLATAAAASTLAWSVRPQVFTLALLPFTVLLLVRGRYLAVPLVMGLWANLHGGVLLGLVVVATWTAVMALQRAAGWQRCAVALALGSAATLVTPLGLQYWPEIFASLRRSQVHRLHEWQPAAWPPNHPAFWVLALGLVGFCWTRWRLLDTTAKRALAASAIVLLPVAARSQRNIAAFALLAGPAVTHLLGSRATGGIEASRPTRAAAWLLATSAAAAAALVLVAWQRPLDRLGWRPLTDGAVAAIEACPGRLYNGYADGGPIIWFVPEKKVFLDSRQDQFPAGLIAEATAVELGADPWPLFERHSIACAAVPPSSPVARTLEDAGWQTRYSDETWRVLSR